MNKKSKNIPKWQITFFLIVILAGWIISLVYIPMATVVVKECTDLIKNYQILKSSSTFTSKIKKIENQIHLLDSMTTTLRLQNQSDQKNIVEALYTYTDSAGLKTSKVEIGEPLAVEQNKEIPVLIQGNGPYEAIGKFIEKIENAHQPVKVKQIVIKASEDKSLTASIDFVIIE